MGITTPTGFAPTLYEIAQKWDQNPSVEFEINSISPQDESVANSSKQQLENGTKLNQSAIDSMAKTSQDLFQAIDWASAILRYQKSARISLAKFLSKLYNFPVQTEDLHWWK